ncbi:MAG: hypothetical protein GX681_00020 [Clostridiaceae bacterium]|nr:hypothetical protein [Clostridiaceae bacterium]
MHKFHVESASMFGYLINVFEADAIMRAAGVRWEDRAVIEPAGRFLA